MNDLKARNIVSVAREVFARYGYRRVNMKDIAEAAGISRPGLYLYFKTKEEIFSAAVAQLAQVNVERIREGLERHAGAEQQLLFAFEIWTVEIFDLTLKSPEAKELSEISFVFAREALDEGQRDFEAVLASILKAHVRAAGSKMPLPADRMAHLLGCSVRGFKMIARDSAQLRRMIRDLLRMCSLPGQGRE